MLTPRQIADRLDDRFRLLTCGSRTVLPRQQTLRAVVDWSWDLLDDATNAPSCARLSVFAGGCDLAAAEAVCGPASTARRARLPRRQVPRRRRPRTPDGPMRYRLLETVAEYAARAPRRGRRDRAASRAARTSRTTANSPAPPTRCCAAPASAPRSTGSQREHENLRTALRHAVAARDEQEALCLVLSLSWYWQMRDLRVDARHWSARSMDLGPDPFAPPVAPRRARVRALHGHARRRRAASCSKRPGAAST